MRGNIVKPIPVPLSGLRVDVPPHLAPPDSLVDGTNVFIELDGTLRPRYGYTALQAAAPIVPTVGTGVRISGGIAFQDQNGDFQYVVSTATDWFALIGSAWADITDPANPQNGAIDNPARFVVFWQGGVAYVIGVDGFSSPKRWSIAQATYSPLNNTPSLAIASISGDGTTATVTLVTGVSNIVVGDSITIAGNTQSAFNVAATVTAVTSPTTFTFASGTNSSGTGGTVTDNTTMVAPAANDIAVITNRVVVVNTTENGSRFIHRVRWSASNDATRWPQLAFIDVLDSEDDPIVAIQPLGQNLAAIYGQNSIFLLQAVAGDDSSAFTVERLQTAEQFDGPASPAAIALSEGLHYYASYTGKLYSFDGVQVQTISGPIDALIQSVFGNQTGVRTHAVKLSSRRHMWFFIPAPGVTGILDDPSAAIVFDLQRQIFLPLQTFSEAITASFSGQVSLSLTWQNCPYTWFNIPFTWDNAPIGLETDTLTCTESGEVDTFFRGFQDGANFYNVQYFATWAYLYDPKNVYKLNFAEFFFKPVPQSGELLTCEFDTLTHPYDVDAPLVSFAALMSEGWTSMPTEPGPLNPSNIRNNLIKMSIQSSKSFGGAALGGGTLYLYEDPRGNYGNG